jgi:ribosomal protein L15
VLANLVPLQTRKVKIILSGELKRKVSVDASIAVTKGARAAIEAVGGQVAQAEQA